MPKPTPKMKIQFVPHQQKQFISSYNNNKQRPFSQKVNKSLSNLKKNQSKYQHIQPNSIYSNNQRMDYKNHQTKRPSTTSYSRNHKTQRQSYSNEKQSTFSKLNSFQDINLNIANSILQKKIKNETGDLSSTSPVKKSHKFKNQESSLSNKNFYQIIYQRTSVLVPTSQIHRLTKQRQEKMFADRCKQILSRKKMHSPINKFTNKLSNNMIYQKMALHAQSKNTKEDSYRQFQNQILQGKISKEQLGKLLKMQLKYHQNKSEDNNSKQQTILNKNEQYPQIQTEQEQKQKEFQQNENIQYMDQNEFVQQNNQSNQYFRKYQKHQSQSDQHQFQRLLAIHQAKKRSLSKNQYYQNDMNININNQISPNKKIKLKNGVMVNLSCVNSIVNGVNIALPNDINHLTNTDKLQLLGLVRSAELRKTSNSQNSHQYRNNQANILNFSQINRLRKTAQLKKTHVMLLNGMTCYSLGLNQAFPIKRNAFTGNNHKLPKKPSSQSVSRRVILSRAGSQRTMKFQQCQDSDTSYMKRLKGFLDFIFKVNYSNGIYVPLLLKQTNSNENQEKDFKIGGFSEDCQSLTPIYNFNANSIFKYKVYVGPGNNCLLIKSLLKRRFWFEIVSSYNEPDISLVWTQNKVDCLHQRQNCLRKNEIPKLNFTTEDGITESKGKKIKKQSNPMKNQFFSRVLQNQLEKIQNNKKILPQSKCQKVEQFINSKGYVIPQQIQDVSKNHPLINHSLKSKTSQDQSFEIIEKQKQKPFLVTNHLPNNSMIGSKKKLFKSLFNYYSYLQKDPFNYIPKTYHVQGKDDPQYKRFISQNKKDPQSVWIVKPGQNTNQGRGIKLATFDTISNLIRGRCKHSNGQALTYIIQSYISKPFLYNGRKFDIRHFMLLTSVKGNLKAYWYKQGYIRTSSEKYDIDDLNNEFIHLTNDFIQKYSDTYEKYEPANKLSYAEFQRYLDTSSQYKGFNYNFQKDIIPQMRSIIKDVVMSNFRALDCKRNQNNFEIFGFDFMIDRNFKPWLIEINFNPCLAINCPLLNRVIPQMVECSLRIAVDPLFPPKNHYPISKRFYLSDNYLKNLKYELIFDQMGLQKFKYQNHQDDKQKIKQQLNQKLNKKQRGYYYYQQAIQYADGDQLEEEYCDEGKQIQDLIL